MTDAELSSLLPPIPHDANKYTRGSLLVLAGSSRFPGAAILAAQAAARTGVGYVTLGIPEPAAPIAQAHLLSIPVIALPSTEGAFAQSAWAAALAQLAHIDALALGPGLTVTPSTIAFVEAVLKETTVPLLLDADALNILSACYLESSSSVNLCGAELSRRVHKANPENKNGRNNEHPPFILTPHAGELKRLLTATTVTNAQQLATQLNAIVVAKGPKTQIFSPTATYTCTTGTPALAKAGTGDVLSGVIGSLLAQGVTPFDAAALGVELHARAGCAAEAKLGRRSVCAEDVIAFLPNILKSLDAPI
jgi:NAD(P)H-hydrate epimerase